MYLLLGIDNSFSNTSGSYFMKYITLLTFLFSLQLFADEAAYYGVDLQQGVVFSVTENPHISLKKEILWLPEMKGWEAEFRVLLEFENSADSAITLKTTFPIYLNVGGLHYMDRRTRKKYKAFWPRRPFETCYNCEDSTYETRIISEDLSLLKPFDFSMTHDGKDVETEFLLIEKDIEKEDANVTEVYLFHTLTFPPKSRSTLLISYKSHVEFESYKDDHYPTRLRYVIGTGGTWKGDIDSLYIVFPTDVYFEGYLFDTKIDTLSTSPFLDIDTTIIRDTEISHTYRGALAEKVILLENFNPTIKEVFTFLKHYTCDESKWECSDTSNECDYTKCVEEGIPDPEFMEVENIQGSSCIMDNAVVLYDWDGEVYLSSPYDPMFALDYTKGTPPLSDLTTTWAFKDSLEPTLSFYLTSPATGVTVYTGYHKNKSLWKANGRPLLLEWEYSEFGDWEDSKEKKSEKWETKLKDIFGPQKFTRNFKPGHYTITVKGIKKGIKYNDACISGIAFHPQRIHDDWYKNGMNKLKKFVMLKANKNSSNPKAAQKKIPKTIPQKVPVNDITDFASNLANNRTYHFSAGSYNITSLYNKSQLTAVKEDSLYEKLFGKPHYKWRCYWNGEEEDDSDSCNMFTIHDLSSITLKGLGKKPEKTKLFSEDEDAIVVVFDNCKKVTLNNLWFGHITNSESCLGGVLQFVNCDTIVLDNIDMYGTGFTGFEIFNAKQVICKNSRIWDCSGGIFNLRNSDDVLIDNCTFYNNKSVGSFSDIRQCPKVTISNCVWKNNKGKEASLLQLNESNLSIKNATVTQNNVETFVTREKSAIVILEDVTMTDNHTTIDTVKVYQRSE